MSTETSYPHLEMNRGVLSIGKTRYTVLHLAGEHYHHGWTAEEILRQHADLRPEEVYSALTYFYDHYDEVVAELQAESEFVAAHHTQPVSRAELLRRRSRAT